MRSVFPAVVQQKARKRNFKNPYDPETNQAVTDWDGKIRVVLNLLYRPVDVSREELVEKVRQEMKSRGAYEALLIDTSGFITHIKM